METIKPGKVLYMPKRRTGSRMSSLERVRAYEGMQQAVALANMTLAAVSRLGTAARTVGRVMFGNANSGRSSAIQAEMRGW